MTHKLLSLLFSAAVLIAAAGCFEEKELEQTPEPFTPVEPGIRLERHCDVLCLNTEAGTLTPLEQLQESLGKESLDKLAKAAKDKMLDVSAKKETLPEPVERFMLLNKNVPAQVMEAMKNSNVRNLSVFLVKVDASYYAVRTFEYIGQNFELDWLDLIRNPDYVEWNNACEECQIPVTGKSGDGGLIQWSISGDEILYLPLENRPLDATAPAPVADVNDNADENDADPTE